MRVQVPGEPDKKSHSVRGIKTDEQSRHLGVHGHDERRAWRRRLQDGGRHISACARRLISSIDWACRLATRSLVAATSAADGAAADGAAEAGGRPRRPVSGDARAGAELERGTPQPLPAAPPVALPMVPPTIDPSLAAWIDRRSSGVLLLKWKPSRRASALLASISRCCT